MGQFLQSPDPAIKLAQQYGIRGLFSPDLVPSLQPVVVIDDLTGGIENIPRRIATGTVTKTGVAATVTVFRFETPPGIIAHITKIWILPETGTDMDIHWGASVIAPATFSAGAYTDGRLRSEGQIPAARFGMDDYATPPTPTQGKLTANANNTLALTHDVSWIMGRTDAFDFLEIWDSAADQNLTVAITWEEFSAEPVR